MVQLCYLKERLIEQIKNIAQLHAPYKNFKYNEVDLLKSRIKKSFYKEKAGVTVLVSEYLSRLQSKQNYRGRK